MHPLTAAANRQSSGCSMETRRHRRVRRAFMLWVAAGMLIKQEKLKQAACRSPMNPPRSKLRGIAERGSAPMSAGGINLQSGLRGIVPSGLNGYQETGGVLLCQDGPFVFQNRRGRRQPDEKRPLFPASSSRHVCQMMALFSKSPVLGQAQIYMKYTCSSLKRNTS
jgi:hypothetical protein